MEETKTKAKRVGTSKTEAIIGTAANKLVQATTALANASDEAKKLVVLVEEQTLKATDLEEKIASLEEEYKQKRNSANVELSLAYKADQEQFAREYARANNMQLISTEELNKLASKAKYEEDVVKQRISEEVTKVTNMYESDKKIKDAEFASDKATLTSENESLKKNIAFLQDEIKSWKTALDNERAASVERAKASSVGSINVSPAGGR
jgi:hypothetical protein